MKRGRPQNLFLRLRQRETIAAKPCTEVNNIRHISEVVTPSSVVRNVQLGDCHVCRFTPSGRHLVCFSMLQHDMLLYTYTGLQFGTRTEPDAEAPQLPESATALGGHFELRWRRSLVGAPHVLCKDFCLALHKEAFLVVASQSPPTSGRGSSAGGGPAALPLVATTTIFLVRARDGEVTDTLELADDFVHLSHNAGVAACGDRIAALGLRSQTIHVHQVLADGRLAPLAQLGQHLALDDPLLLAAAAAVERRWREANPKAARQADHSVRRLEASGAPGTSHMTAATPPLRRAASHAAGAGAGAGAAAARGAQLQALASGERPNSAVLGQLLNTPSSPGPGASASAGASNTDRGSSEGGGGPSLITGLRQRVLAYLCHALRDPAMARMLESPTKGGSSAPGVGVPSMQRAASAALGTPQQGGSAAGGASGLGGVAAVHGAAGSQRPHHPPQQQPQPPRARDRFILNFESLASLVVWKAQFMDDNHLLLALGPPDASALRHTESQQQAAFLAVYSLQDSIIVSMLPNSSSQLLEMYLQDSAVFNAPAITCTWERFLTPAGTPASARAAVDRQMAHQYWTMQQVTRRVLAAIPPSSQVLCASPYLDANLFQYDEKHISPTIRPRALAEVPLKFLMRGRREVVCLKIGGGQFEAPPPGPRPTKQLVTWHLHPVLPFVLGVLQKANAPTQAIIYHRV